MMGDNPPRFMYTARLEVRYRKNVPIGVPLKIVGKAGKSRSRTAQASAQIFDQEGNLLAEADALLVDVPTNVVEGVDLEEIGWRVYPKEDGA